MTTKRISCFVPYADEAQAATTVSELRTSDAVGEVWLLTADGTLPPLPGCRLLPVQDFSSSETVRRMAQHADGDYALFYLKETHLSLGLFALERMVRIAEDSGAGLVYADHYRLSDGRRSEAPVIDYQPGSLRDDFDFGPLWLLRTDRLNEAAARLTADYRYAGFYDLRLKLSQRAPLVHVNEYLYTEVEDNMRPSGERLFDYVDPRNRERQVEMEQACTEHLKEVGAYLAPQFEEPDLDAGQFEYEASVIIPVRNRVRTIGDAIRSVLGQRTSFPFNLIVVDNHSTDGTTEAIDRFADDPRLLHLVPRREDLGIGGCWNLAAAHPQCGRFCVQLDSDAALRHGSRHVPPDRPATAPAAARHHRPPGMDTRQRAQQRLAHQRAGCPARVLHAPAARTTAARHVLWRRLCRRIGHVAAVPHRARLRRGLPLPPVGRQFGRQPGHHPHEPEQSVQRPHPDMGTASTHRPEPMQGKRL